MKVLKWWKILSIICILYTIIAGFLLPVPALPILHESIRNLYFHVTMWFSMILILSVSVIYGVIYLNKGFKYYDIVSAEAAKVGLFLGILGVTTGSLWANNTWGAWWVNDAKLNGAAISLLFYFAYLILRNTISDDDKKGRVSAIYNIFAYTMMIVFLGVLPRMTDSLHPGNGGNPGFGGYDLDGKMKIVFYPAIIGWSLLAVWILNIRIRMKSIIEKLHTH
ncbi:MAG: cytochrome c biogenesis protein CcsA [Bacteroidia bacterium]|nr:cytochrome c biogenesis protein CcsA [Bacteroidia bacterium]MCZ2249035.1 cytochrome c biogenesis protein [Bacteroidia bacterium]